MLFNCAALASQIAAEQSPDSDEGLKVAAKHYQVRTQSRRGERHRAALKSKQTAFRFEDVSLHTGVVLRSDNSLEWIESYF